MKLRITLTKSEYEGLATIANNLAGLIREESDLEHYSYLAALEELALRFLPKLHAGTIKAKQTISLTDMQTLAFWRLLNCYVDFFGPYEYAFACGIIEQIDKQHRNEATLRQGVRDLSQQKQLN